MDSVYLEKIIDVVKTSALGSLSQSQKGNSQLYSDRWGLWLTEGHYARDYVGHGPTIRSCASGLLSPFLVHSAGRMEVEEGV